MAKQFSREEILKNMREKIARKEALLVCGCGTGLIRHQNQAFLQELFSA